MLLPQHSSVWSFQPCYAFRDCQDGLQFRCRADSGLLNLRRLNAVTKVKETVVREHLFADDCVPNASTEQKMQQEMDCFSKACGNFDLISSTKKTVMYQPVPGQPYHYPHITVRGLELRAVDSFTYLGSTLSRAVNIDTEINNRIAKASSNFRKTP